MLADLRLYQLISPGLPVGAFTYSQGLEWAVEARWVTSETELEAWITSMLQNSMATLELPVLLRLRNAFSQQDAEQVSHWCDYLLACRETSELRKEERQRGQALAVLLPHLEVMVAPEYEESVRSTQVAGFAVAAQHFDIAAESACVGYLWSWLDNAVMAGVKLIPLGQTSGQKLLLRISEQLPGVLAKAIAIEDDQVGSSTPAQAIASSRHETQYSRLFRS
ncbi:urease accessory protein UreF [Neptunomonas qingdaonensis]|uniref:Urease accessory protein UreF n=1 Tax=Neptunomonas qingdaonensis TaxID=1045558 RepID=A0A1I2M9D9_9GAMM|nr:urease accessory protein UreF [Neptunomonas qingdaonensis]SFF88083.1 urease accessory protein [Neptunomonas qingdaonensis]